MILLDTNILSTFAKIKRFDILFQVFPDNAIFISSNVFEEINDALEHGYEHADEILHSIKEGRIQVMALTQDEHLLTTNLPQSFGRGEQDSLAIAKKRSAVFVTNEKKVVKYCRQENIPVVTLNTLLRFLWEEKVCTKKQVQELIYEIETKDKLIIQSKEEIFED